MCFNTYAHSVTQRVLKALEAKCTAASNNLNYSSVHANVHYMVITNFFYSKKIALCVSSVKDSVHIKYKKMYVYIYTHTLYLYTSITTVKIATYRRIIYIIAQYRWIMHLYRIHYYCIREAELMTVFPTLFPSASAAAVRFFSNYDNDDDNDVSSAQNAKPRLPRLNG